ncbi:MAG: alpha-L-fucosidase [Eubacteriales bacterium]
MENSVKQFLSSAASVKPSKRQMDWYDTEFYAFVHFSPNTYTGLEWGLGNEDPAIFNPTQLDCDGWVEAVKSAGMKGLVLTAKHHDGFCLWPSKHTEHCIKNSPFMDGKGDIVRETAQACRRGGIKFGFYLSPWDRNSKYYGTPEYNDYYRAQLTELLTGYGEVFMVWFDGACGEGPNGKRQEYDFDSYIELIRKYQPNAVIFNDHGPDVRWCGNESGTARQAEWAVVPNELCHRSEKQTSGAPMSGGIEGIYNTDHDIGELSQIIYSRGLSFAGSEIDMSIRPGWFYHESEEPHSLERLFHTYINSVGGNACFNLNVPPAPSGRFDERDVKRLSELGEAIRSAFSSPLDVKVTRKDTDSDTQCVFELERTSGGKISYVVLAEDIAQGQRVDSFLLQQSDGHGGWDTIYRGRTIGHKKICPVSCGASLLRLYVTSARGEVVMREISLY